MDFKARAAQLLPISGIARSASERSIIAGLVDLCPMKAAFSIIKRPDAR